MGVEARQNGRESGVKQGETRFKELRQGKAGVKA
jgi:hypothetical protein